MTITQSQREVLLDIIWNTERLDKMSVALDDITRQLVLSHDDLDEEWFNELKAAAQ